MRLGIVLSPFAGRPAAELRAVAQEAEARGYDTAWAGEVAGGDALTLLALVAGHTERLRVATGVLPVQTRTPVVLGLSAATLDHAAPGRFALGLGLSSRTIVEQWHGLPFSPALGQLREVVEIVRRVTSGERVSFEGTFHRVRNFRLTGPVPARPVPIYLAALGREMLELAGEIADGVLLNWLAPEAVPAAVASVEAGARRAGRRLDGFEIAAFVRTSVTDDAEAARRTLARDITGYATVDVYAAAFRAAGFGDEVDAIETAWRAGDRAGAVQRVSPRLLDGLGVVGTEASCRARLAEFARAGLTQPVVLPFAPAGAGEAPDTLLRTLRA
ncbi:MAG TPA: LLM class flavin-dependent oxidoreductase, partial [Methylomirabilota bacterium]|nr:LLM class flavin-dependent oxidoreductase [Methylomirabilota bacterium]